MCSGAGRVEVLQLKTSASIPTQSHASSVVVPEKEEDVKGGESIPPLPTPFDPLQPPAAVAPEVYTVVMKHIQYTLHT